MKLDFLDSENFNDAIIYRFLYLDSVYREDNYWNSSVGYDNNKVLDLEISVFDNILLNILNNFSFFDEYSVTNFFANDLNKLSNLLQLEKDLINNLSEKEFQDKYSLIFKVIKNSNYFFKKYDLENEIILVRNDVIKILNHVYDLSSKAFKENKILTIVGV